MRARPLSVLLLLLALPATAQAATNVTAVGGQVTIQGDQGTIADPPESSDLLVVVRPPATAGFPYTFNVIETGTDATGQPIEVASPGGSCQLGGDAGQPPSEASCTSMGGFSALSTFLNAGDDSIEVDDDPAAGAAVDAALRGGNGDDTLIGGEGDDTYLGGAGGDAMADRGASTGDAHSYIAEGATKVRITVADGRRNDGDADGAEGDDLGAGIDSFEGTPGNDTFVGSAAGETFNGQSGGDTITGNGGSDTLIGDTQNDTINARDGEPDTVACGGDADTVEADHGDLDTLTGCETVNQPAGAGGLPGVTFPESRTKAVGTGPHDIAAGVRLEGAADADPDLATPNQALSTLSTLVNDGDADFAETRYDHPPGTSPRAIDYGKLDGDAFDDLVTVGSANNSVNVFTGNGTGGVVAKPPQTGLGLDNPRDVVVGHFDTGATLDLAVANANGDDVAILLGNGDGTFAAGPVLTVGDNPQAVAAGTLDADGLQDLVVANTGSNTISTFFGTGSGFDAGPVLATGVKPHGIEIGDFGRDDSDVAVVNYGSDTVADASHSVSVFSNDGDGVLTPAPGSPFPTAGGAGGRDLAAGDFNGDGETDVATANVLSSNVSVLEGNPDGSFEPALNLTAGTQPIAVEAIPLRDPPAGAPPKSDLAVANFGSNTVTVLLANSPPPEMKLSASAYAVDEGAGTVTLTVTRTGTGASSVGYQTADESAKAPGDYTAASGTVSFTGAETAKPITVPIADDTADEDDEVFTVTLTDAEGGTLAFPAAAGVTIHDDDTAATTPGVSQPVNVTAPEMSGPEAAVGVTLTGTAGTWTGGGDITYTGVWLRCPGTDLAQCKPAASGPFPASGSYTIKREDVGRRLIWSVIATNRAGATAAYAAHLTRIVPAPTTDTDKDGLSDYEETGPIDWTGDGVDDIDLSAFGADPRHRDLFVEVDNMKSRHLRQDSVALAVQTYANAPVGNPDGTTGIALHVDNGPDSVMNPRTGATWGTLSESSELEDRKVLVKLGSWDDFDQIKVAPGGFAPERQTTFRYVIYGFRHTAASEPSSGKARSPEEDFRGSDMVVTLAGVNCEKGVTGCGDTLNAQAGTFLHEFGHLVGLRHGGGDNINQKPNYLSVMNYEYQFFGLLRVGVKDGLFDYSHWDANNNPNAIGDLSENALDETKGVTGAGDALNYRAVARCYKKVDGVLREFTEVVTVGAPADWNCDGDKEDTRLAPATYSITPDTNATVLPAYDDWASLRYEGGWVDGLLRASSGRLPARRSTRAAAVTLPALPRTVAITEPDPARILKSTRLLAGDRRKPRIRTRLKKRTLTVTARDNRRIDQVRVTVGRRVRTAYAKAAGAKTARLRIKLAKGRRKVLVVAIDAASNGRAKRLRPRVR